MGIEVFPVPASGPSLAEITSAITSNAAPSSVTMPAITSSITTNAAPASVTMAAITSSITTNAASSGVTLAAIGTQVANNASPFGGTWTLISSSNLSTGTTTFSGLSNYKYLRFIASNIAVPGGNVTLQMRINADSGSNYVFGRYNFTIASTTGVATNVGSTNVFNIGPTGNNSSTYFDFTIYNATSTAPKVVMWRGVYISGIEAIVIPEATGIYRGTSAVSSVTILNSGNESFSSVPIYILGAN